VEVVAIISEEAFGLLQWTVLSANLKIINRLLKLPSLGYDLWGGATDSFVSSLPVYSGEKGPFLWREETSR
jgi:hypothetical protein